jgi:AraC family transcriptional regulator
MEWLSCLNEAVNYIEAHLEDEVCLEQAARLARCSSFQFQRMF